MWKWQLARVCVLRWCFHECLVSNWNEWNGNKYTSSARNTNCWPWMSVRLDNLTTGAISWILSILTESWILFTVNIFTQSVTMWQTVCLLHLINLKISKSKSYYRSKSQNQIQNLASDISCSQWSVSVTFSIYLNSSGLCSPRQSLFFRPQFNRTWGDRGDHSFTHAAPHLAGTRSQEHLE